jgi:hypothetical protein
MEDAEWFLPVIKRANLCRNVLGPLNVSLDGSIVLCHGIDVEQIYVGCFPGPVACLLCMFE